MLYLTGAIRNIKKIESKCISTQDIINRICNFIMPYWDDIMKEISYNISKLENILSNLFNSTKQYYTKPILENFKLYYNTNAHTTCMTTKLINEKNN